MTTAAGRQLILSYHDFQNERLAQLWYLELLDAELLALLLSAGQHAVKGIVVFLLRLLPLPLFFNDFLHVGVQDFSGFDPLPGQD